jgi:eukaryotic-like serine/threonine-protein kinase
MSANALGLSSALADRYRIERELGAGGMATVYLAEDVRHRRRVALKVLRPELSAVLGPERFLKEIELTAGLQHPHILPLFDSGEASGQLYYVMPLVDGETLRARLDRETQLPIVDALRIASEVADALQYAHERGVVHRDIKPENILLQGGAGAQHALVADFGIALAVEQAGGARMTQTGLSLGTPHYMAPEQAMGERTIDARADVYALGTVLYEMLAGEPPFTGPTAQAIVARVLTEAPRSLLIARPSVPPPVDDAVRTALEKLPADRHATAAAFAAALRGEGSAASVRRATTAKTTRTARWRAIAVPLAAAALGASAMALIASFRDDRPVANELLRVMLAIPSDQRMQEGWFSVSADGRTMAYSAYDERILVKRADELRARELPGGARGWMPIISPDGREVAYVTSSPGDLRVVATTGGVTRTLVRDSAISFGGIWAANGWIYCVIGKGAIARVHPEGGALEVLVRPDSARDETFFHTISPLPGDRALLAVLVRRGGGNEVVAIDLRTGERKTLAEGIAVRYLASGHIFVVQANGSASVTPFDADRLVTTGAAREVLRQVLLSDGLGATLAIGENGTLFHAPPIDRRGQVVRVGRDGVSRPVDATWHDELAEVALSPDGSRLAVTRMTPLRSEVWVKELGSGALTLAGVGGYVGYRPSWSPDGRTVLYIGDVVAAMNSLLERPLGSTGPPRVMATGPRGIDEGMLSRDGRWLVVRSGVGGARDILARRVGVDSVLRPIIATDAQELSPALSPDGRWLAYVSDESGRLEVYVAPFPDVGTGRRVASRDGGTEPAWSPDGRELFFKRGDTLQVVRVVAAATGIELSAQRALFPVAEYFADRNHTSYAVAPDGAAFYFVRRASGTGERLIMVRGWFAELGDATR